ncbi:MAG TPA: hypothetical protein VEY09_10215 [Pyrinomonadaceae bacterium]|nr:hypothetical protein [Pyrinomonadaceae bacterium]
MKFLKQTITAALMLCALAAGVLAFEPQRNDQKGPPPKDPKVVENPEKKPPPREDKKNDNRGQDNRGNRP